MTRRLPQSTSRVVTLKVFLSTDHVSAATGKTVAITISKNGGAFANPNAGATNATEIANGWYKVTLDTTDTGTLGDLVVRGTAASCDDSEQLCDVVSNVAQTGDSFARLGAPAGASTAADIAAVKVDTAAMKVKTDFLPSATAGAAGGLFIAGVNAATTITTALTANIIGNITGALSGAVGSVTGAVGSIASGGIAAASFAAGALDAVWSTATRLLTAGTNIALAKGTGVTGFTDISAAQVNAEVVDAINVDTYAEPGQGAPAATASLAAKINYLFKAWRNKKTQTATAFNLFADDATTVDQKATVSDDGTTYTSGEVAAGP